MPITSREARKLSTTSEWPLIEASLPAALRQLTPARLKAKVARARTLRDKYVDLAKKQYREARTHRGATPDASLNERTTRKAELFSEVLGRFEAALAAVAAVVSAPAKAPTRSRVSARTRDRKPPRTAATKVAAKVAAKAAPVPPRKVKASQAPLVPKSALARRSGQERIQAHVSSRGRKRQATRDSR